MAPRLAAQAAAINSQKQQAADPYKRSRANEPIDNTRNDFALLTGNANPELSRKVAARLGTSLAAGKVQKFADGEVRCEFNKADVEGKHCYILQPTCRPVNDSFMELVTMISACRRAGALSVTVIAPYYGYARQDRCDKGKATPITSGDTSQILEFMGANRIISVDLHSLQTTGMVTAKCQFEDYEASFAGLSYFLENIEDKKNLVVVSPDAGGVKRATAFHKHFIWHGHTDVGLAMISKERKAANEVGEVVLIGDVKGKQCIIVDDMCDTAGTLCAAGKALKDMGATDVYAFITHGIFSGPAADRISKSVFKKVITTDSMPLIDGFAEKVGEKHHTVSIDLLLAEVIRRTHQREDKSVIHDIPIY